MKQAMWYKQASGQYIAHQASAIRAWLEDIPLRCLSSPTRSIQSDGSAQTLNALAVPSHRGTSRANECPVRHLLQKVRVPSRGSKLASVARERTETDRADD